MNGDKNRLSKFLYNQIINSFSQVIADLNRKEDSSLFLKDFFTDIELETFSKRLAIAYWLKKGRNYSNIKTNLKVPVTTISKVSKMMKKEGFSLGLKKMEAEEWANVWTKRIRSIIKK